VEHDLDLGLSHREAGSTAVQELAFTLADGFAYVEAALKAGMDIDSFARACRFSSTRTSISLRRSASSAPPAASMRTGCATSMGEGPAFVDAPFPHANRRLQRDRPATREQHRTGRLRSALGRTRRHAVAAHELDDEVLALPTEKSVEIALRTQQVLAYETNVTNVADPLGGSYFIEALTSEMERQALDYFRQIEDFGA